MKNAVFVIFSFIFISCTSSSEIFTISNRDAKKVYREMVKEEKTALKKYGSMQIVYDSLYASKY